MIYRWSIIVLITSLLLLGACAKPLASGKLQELPVVEEHYTQTPNDLYYALRWALAQQGYPVADEDLDAGHIATVWVPAKADSHYIAPFGVKDYGTTGAYYQLAVQVMPSQGGTKVAVRSRVKSVIHNLRSSLREERALHREMANYLRTHNVKVTNLGVE